MASAAAASESRNDPTRPAAGLVARLRTSTSWYALGIVSSQGSTFLVNVILANVFGRETFGMFTVVQTTLMTLVQVAQFATGYTATKFTAEFRTTDPARAGRVLGFCEVLSLGAGVIGGLGLFLAAPWVASSALGAPALGPMLRVVSGAVVLIVVNGFQMGALAGLERFDRLAMTGMLNGLTYFVFALAGALLDGLMGAAWGILASSAIQWLILRRVLALELRAHGIHMTMRDIGRERSTLLGFALPAAISGATQMPAVWLASTILVQQPGGFAQIAIFSAANSFRIAVLLLPNIVNSVGLAIVNNAKGSGDAEQYRKAFWTNLGAMVGVASAGALCVIVCGPLLLRLFGKDFTGGYRVLVLLAAAAVIEAIWLGAHQILHSKARMWRSFFSVAVPRDGLLIVTATLLVPTHLAVGLGAAYVIAHATVALSVGLTARSIGLDLADATPSARTQ